MSTRSSAAPSSTSPAPVRRFSLRLLLGIFLLALVTVHFARWWYFKKTSPVLREVVTRFADGTTRERYFLRALPGGTEVRQGPFVEKFPNGRTRVSVSYDRGLKTGREIVYRDGPGNELMDRIDHVTLYGTDGRELFTVTF